MLCGAQERWFAYFAAKQSAPDLPEMTWSPDVCVCTALLTRSVCNDWVTSDCVAAKHSAPDLHDVMAACAGGRGCALLWEGAEDQPRRPLG